MEFTEDDLQVLCDSVAYVRANRKHFLGTLPAHPAALIGEVAGCACLLTDSRIVIGKCEHWWFLGSATDWLEDSVHVFSQLTPFPRYQQNSFRPEILLTAFADAVATVLNGVYSNISNASEPEESLLELAKEGGYVRVVAFRCPLPTIEPA